MKLRPVAPLVALSIAAAACSGGDDTARDDADSEPAISAAPPATIDGQPVDEPDDDSSGEASGDGAPVDGTSGPDDDLPPPDPDTTAPPPTVDPPPADELARVISLSATHTETIFAIGAEGLLIAVDPGSDHPAPAAELQIGALRPSTGSTEAFTDLDPDLVIIGDDPTDLAGRLGALGIPTWRGETPASVAEAFAQIEELGAALGRPDAAAALVADMRGELAALRAGLPADGTLTYFHENDPGFITSAPGSFIDLVYAELGLRTIIDGGGNGPTGFVQSSSDAVIAGDPDVVVLADIDCCGVTADTAIGRPGWDAIAAIQTGAIAEVPDALPQRWGPRLVEWWRLVAAAAATAADAG